MLKFYYDYFLILMILVFPLTRLIVGTSVGTTASIVPLVIAAFPFVARLVESSLRELNPNIIEMRTFLSDKNMTPTKLRRYEELRERVDDESFIAESYNLSVWGSIYQKNNIAIPKD